MDFKEQIIEELKSSGKHLEMNKRKFRSFSVLNKKPYIIKINFEPRDGTSYQVLFTQFGQGEFMVSLINLHNTCYAFSSLKEVVPDYIQEKLKCSYYTALILSWVFDYIYTFIMEKQI
jgi:hypothetical protein